MRRAASRPKRPKLLHYVPDARRTERLSRSARPHAWTRLDGLSEHAIEPPEGAMPVHASRMGVKRRAQDLCAISGDPPLEMLRSYAISTPPAVEAPPGGRRPEGGSSLCEAGEARRAKRR